MIWDDFYQQPALYDLEYTHRTHDVAWYRALAGDAETVLELGAGTGRITLPMALTGAHVTAVDLCRPMLEILQARRAKLEDPSCIGRGLAAIGGGSSCIDYGMTLVSGLHITRRSHIGEARVYGPGGSISSRGFGRCITRRRSHAPEDPQPDAQSLPQS